jgi:hypothetical protein
MDVLDRLRDEELTQTLIAEIAKATNEIRCAQADLNKAQSRLKFILVVAHTLIERQKD